MSGKEIWIAITALAMLIAMTASFASAEHLAQNHRGTSATVYRAGQPTAQYKVVEHRVYRGHHPTGAFVVHHEMQDRIVTKAKAAAGNMNMPGYIEVRAHSHTLYLDRHADYVNHDEAQKDGQHLLAKAQGLGNDHYNTRAKLIFGGPVDESMDVKEVAPLMIFEKPGKDVPLHKQITRK